MPRISAEARSAAAWREGDRHPEPRKGMPRAARQIWRDIVECRPMDFFAPGSLHLLRTYCEVSATLDAIGPDLVASPDDDKLIQRVTRLGSLQATLAQKLRLSIQSALRIESGKLTERVRKPAEPALLGGDAIKWPQDQQPGKRPRAN